MTFRSIVNPLLEDNAKAEMSRPPAYFADLNLDQIVASITSGKEEYNLAPFFHKPLTSREAVEYRQQAMRDLEDPTRYDAVTRFAEAMRSVRQHLTQAGKLSYKYQKEAWLLDAVELYCQCVENLLSDLRAAAPSSPGLVGFLAFLDAYAGSPTFKQLLQEIATLKAKLSSVRYTLLIGDGVITVSGYHDEPDYGAEIQADFEKFKQGAAADHIFKFLNFEQMNHIQAGVLDRVARLNPEIFAELDGFSARSSGFFDPTVLRFDREVQFYVAYIAHMRRITAFPASLNERNYGSRWSGSRANRARRTAGRPGRAGAEAGWRRRRSDPSGKRVSARRGLLGAREQTGSPREDLCERQACNVRLERIAHARRGCLRHARHKTPAP